MSLRSTWTTETQFQKRKEGREGRGAEGKQEEENKEERGAKNLKIKNDHGFHVRSNLVFLKMSL